jgi:hypothetical protein
LFLTPVFYNVIRRLTAKGTERMPKIHDPGSPPIAAST